MSQQPPEFGQPQQPAVPPPPPMAAGQPMPPGAQPPLYGQQQWGQQPYAPVPRTDGFAIASLCCSLVFIVACVIPGLATSIVAVVLGTKSRRKIRESNGMIAGDGLAKAGVIVGWVGIGLQLLVVIGYAAIFVSILNSSPQSN